uniref:Uncharacterized protein n=1 Tax=Anopheles maculatus TaxID=74869 RepID=A0A182SK86_9DIPT
MIYLVVAGVILFAYLFLYDWWTSYDFGIPSIKTTTTTTIVRHGAVQNATEVRAATTGGKEKRACDTTADGCDTEPPIGATALTNGNSTAEPQSALLASVDATVDQVTSQLKQVSFSNANFLYDRPQPRRNQQKQKRSLNRPQDKPCFVNGQQEQQRPENAPVDTNDNHIKMDGTTSEPATAVPMNDENSSQERASFIVGEGDSQLDDELEANDAFPQTMENGGGLRSSSSYEMNLTEKRRRLR